MPTTSPVPDTDTDTNTERPWVVLLGNDPVNTFGYVAHALAAVFGYPAEKATELMMTAHNEGRAAVWAGERERAEAYAHELHSWGLWATVAEDK